MLFGLIASLTGWNQSGILLSLATDLGSVWIRMIAKRVCEGDVVKNAILSFWRYCCALHRWSNDVGTMPYAGFIRSSMTVQCYVQEIVPHVLPNHKTLSPIHFFSKIGPHTSRVTLNCFERNSVNL